MTVFFGALREIGARHFQNTFMKTILQSLRILLALTALTGFLYPLVVTGVSHFAFPRTATGSLVKRDGQIAGSALLAQKTESPKYFWPRPSAADYAAVASGAGNLAPDERRAEKNRRRTPHEIRRHGARRFAHRERQRTRPAPFPRSRAATSRARCERKEAPARSNRIAHQTTNGRPATRPLRRTARECSRSESRARCATMNRG